MTVSVAIALYNGERFIRKQLDSIRLQKRPVDQVVLCDDGSSDGTVALVQEYILAHHLEETWTVSVNEKNLGYIHNFYHAMSQCHTDLIFLSDQDDLWAEDKILNMTKIMKDHAEISLLSCKYGIIDAQDHQLHSLLERESKQTLALRRVTVDDIMRAYRWPGMVMCIRRSFFDKLPEQGKASAIPHDMMFALCAADCGQFFEYDYIGAFHRRHDNNTAREEHRIRKVLNLPRKLKEIGVFEQMYSEILNTELPVSEETRNEVAYRLKLFQSRKLALEEKSMRQLLHTYWSDSRRLLRKASLLCDIWLICFGKSKVAV